MIWFAYGAVAAAAFILSGCNNDTNDEGKVPPKDSPKDPTKKYKGPEIRNVPSAQPVAGVASPPDAEPKAKPFAPIEETLKGHPRAMRAYLLLKQAGNSDEKIDAGCHLKDEIQGGQDRKIVPCEVYEYALDHYQGNRLAARAVAESDLPWDFTNWNPFSSEKNSFEIKVEETLKQLKKSRGLKGLEPESPEYKKRLARALFYFVNFPKNAARAKSMKKTWQERTRELTFLGMRDYQDSLFQSGGLGAFDFSNRWGMGDVGGALEALEKNRGGDISKSNILYGVFKAAGLDPFFTRVQMEFANPETEMEIAHGQRATKYSDEYIAVGIPWKESSLLFHSHAMWELDSDTPHEPIPTLRRYMANFSYALGAYHLFYSNDFEKMESLFRQSMRLSPGYAAPYNGLASALENQKKLDDAEAFYRKGLKMNPDEHFLNWNYADFLVDYRKAKPEKVLPHYYRASLDKTYQYYAAADRQKAERIAKAVLKQDPDNIMASKLLGIIR